MERISTWSGMRPLTRRAARTTSRHRRSRRARSASAASWSAAHAKTPAATSSMTTPKPFFTRSSAEAGQGFSTSKTRNRRKPSERGRPGEGDERDGDEVAHDLVDHDGRRVGDAPVRAGALRRVRAERGERGER